LSAEITPAQGLRCSSAAGGAAGGHARTATGTARSAPEITPAAAIRKAEVTITLVYEIDCKVCGVAVFPDDRVLTRQEAEEVRSGHLAEHERNEL
jgi:hypothetical protein